MDTVFALSTAQGKAGVAIIRITGPDSISAIEAIAGRPPEPRQASLRILRSSDGQRLDEALVLVFEEGRSFTGESSAEVHCHGSTAVIAAVLDELSRMPYLYPAEPGEFTRRALQNGKLDLAQVEGLADLIEAETEAQRRQALRILAGDLGKRAEAWRTSLVRATALLEATIDFADEEVPVDVSPEVLQLISGVIRELEKEIAGFAKAERIRSGFEVAIVGAPNVGKSTLLNALAGREAAITSEHAGTTRDVIEVRMDLDGLPVTVLDTAGLRDTQDVVESIGIERARQRAEMADLRVFLVEDGGKPEMTPGPDDLVVVGKADLVEPCHEAVSGKTGQGVPELVSKITAKLKSEAASAGLATRIRHKDAMEKGLKHLLSAQKLIASGENYVDIASEEMRSAVRALDSLVGRIDIENILDEIFASFCLGK